MDGQDVIDDAAMIAVSRHGITLISTSRKVGASHSMVRFGDGGRMGALAGIACSKQHTQTSDASGVGVLEQQEPRFVGAGLQQPQRDAACSSD